MLLCINELFHQNRYAALTIYLEVNSFRAECPVCRTHLFCVCVRGGAQWRSRVNMELVGSWAPVVFSALSRDCSSRLQTPIFAKAVCFIIYGPQQHGGPEEWVSGVRSCSERDTVGWYTAPLTRFRHVVLCRLAHFRHNPLHFVLCAPQPVCVKQGWHFVVLLLHFCRIYYMRTK